MFTTRTARAGLAATAALTVGGLLLAGVTSEAGAAGTGLKTLAEAKNIYFGTALTQSNLSNSTLTAVAGAQFDMVTPGNEMKWDTTEPSNGTYNFGPGDQIVSFAQSHSMRIRGHNLVWHSQLPSWVSSLPSNQVQAAMEAHITTEATHYKGKLYAWDVVNEPFDDSGNLRTDAFYNAMGSGYIADALRTAHAADPNAKLYLNDYNIEGQNAKSDAMYQLVSQLKAQGVPIDGIGLESHFIVGQVPSSMRANMQRFAALGLDVAITELDDRMQTPASNANLAQQATDYAAVVANCLAVPRCVGVSQWGVGDADSWIPGAFPGQGAATMYDNNYQPKPAYNSTATALGGSTTTTPPPPPSSTCKVTDTVNAWNTGLTESITITNTGSSAISGWSLAFTLAGGQAITSAWNATIAPSTGAVTAKNVNYNGSVAPGASVSFGFQASHTGDTSTPGDFTLNGTRCA
ncbi:endo-1,4-beta-xylanase [Kutzneria sp. CA-103260]|uniref:endo-1,4-beta-xylanase n=1 Tax=Kutzneria sp. CA-103260 TaxID=2802641 RepID=UPI001BEFA302|nr:endo-1,4-beta-xylanase [Kutzneria sp. CA-103260]QUQ64633.1 Exoglucanase/xylanase [Kutzneria sp. CA-103260]